jgi:hypothetical protein
VKRAHPISSNRPAFVAVLRPVVFETLPPTTPAVCHIFRALKMIEAAIAVPVPSNWRCAGGIHGGA